MGSPTNQARTRLANRLPGAAAPALFGVAAAFVLANTPAFASAPSAGQAHAQHPAATAAATAVWRQSSTSQAARPATSRTAKHAPARPASYAVKSGDTLSAIAKHFYQDPGYWPVLYWANHRHVRYANDILVGQVLTVPVRPAKIPSPPAVLAPAPAPVAASASTGGQASGPVGTEQAAPAYNPAPVASTSVSTAGDGSFQSCVIARESGGDSQVMNSSGHYGLYQFSSSTWAAYGGNPGDFGNASVAEQNQVFDNAIAAGGQSNWSAYDGC